MSDKNVDAGDEDEKEGGEMAKSNLFEDSEGEEGGRDEVKE